MTTRLPLSMALSGALFLVLDVLAGLVWTLAFPPYSFYPLFILVLPYFFFRVLYAPTWQSAALRGWLWGNGVMWGAYYWLVYTMKTFGHIPIPVGIFGTALYCGAFALQFALLGALSYGIHRLYPIARAWPRMLALATTYAAIDIFFPEHFPWDAALLLAPRPFWLQSLDLWGTVGVTWALYLLAAFFWVSVERWREKRRVLWTQAAVLALGIGAFGAYGLWSLERWSHSTRTPLKTINLVGVQANIGSADKMAAGRFHIADKVSEMMERYVHLSLQVERREADLVLWPETALPDYISMNSRHVSRISDLAQHLESDMLVGAFDLVREGNEGKVFNGAFLFDHNSGAVKDSYYKHVLLAFGEYVPLASVFPSLKQTFEAVSDFSAGPGAKVLTWRDLRLAVSICYEAILPSFMRDLIASKPHLLINITNDSWFGNTREPHFHLYLQAMRSLEFRLPLFRLANTGISAWVGPDGKMIRRTEISEEALLRAEIPIFEPVETVYQKFGYTLARSLLAFALMWILLRMILVFRQKA